MCGIVGYIGKRRASPVLLDGLKKLEYRGYDSAGIAVLDQGILRVVKRQGRVEELGAAHSLDGCIGIGHTRWATHGAPSARNAHPHVFRGIAVVHNGIIENAAALRALCLARGETFLSDTDSEVVAHLIAHAFCGDLLSAVIRAARELTGSFALAVLREGGEEIVCARKKSPLIAAAGRERVSLQAISPPSLPQAGAPTFCRTGNLPVLRRKMCSCMTKTALSSRVRALFWRKGNLRPKGELTRTSCERRSTRSRAPCKIPCFPPTTFKKTGLAKYYVRQST